jgi:hypothetical protein
MTTYRSQSPGGTMLEYAGLRVEVVDKPRDHLRKEDIFDDVIDVVAEARGWLGPTEKGALRETYKFKPFLDADTVFIIHQDGRRRGFCSFRNFTSGHDQIIHMSNAAMSPELQARGAMLFVGLFYPAFLSSRRAEFLQNVILEHQYFTFITQSPVVYGAMRKRGLLYPDAGGESAPDHVRAIARLIASEINPDLAFDADRFVIRKECSFFYRDIPRYKDADVNAFMDRSLNYSDGDVIVGVLRVSVDAIKTVFSQLTR